MSHSHTGLLDELNVAPENPGACAGLHDWGSLSGNLIESINPADEKVIASVYGCSEEDYNTIIEKANLAFQSWRTVPAPKRGEIIRLIGEALRQHKQELGTLVSLEMGKSLQEGIGEVQEMIDIADFAVGQSRMLYGKTMHSERVQHRMYEQWHPYGVVGVITAFNFPVAVWAWNAFIAAICGNTVVWKPSPKTPLCAIAIQHLCNKVCDDHDLSGVFSFFVPEDNTLSEALTRDERVPLISFTGSCVVGRIVGERVAARFGRSILECGGNNAIIVDESANCELALPAVVFGAVGTAGQRCTSTRRVLIHDSLYDQFTQQMNEAYQQLKIGDPLDVNNHMGPVIDGHAIEQYQHAIQTCKRHGAKIIFGGNTLEGPGYYVEPTLIGEVNNDWPIVQEETFAPICYCLRFSELRDAIQKQNSVKQGLSSALFTQNLQHAEQFLAATGSDCGIANINIGTSGAEIGGAFGGEKQTGGGREAGSDAWKNYMRRQTTTINWGNALPLAQGIKFSL